MSTTTINAAPKASRADDLKAMLESRRTDVVRELHDKIRAVRSDGMAHGDLLEDGGRTELDHRICADRGGALALPFAVRCRDCERGGRRRTDASATWNSVAALQLVDLSG